MDSLLSIELRNSLGASLGQVFPPLSYSTIQRSRHWSDLSLATAARHALESTTAKTNSRHPDKFVDEIEALSDEEVDRLSDSQSGGRSAMSDFSIDLEALSAAPGFIRRRVERTRSGRRKKPPGSARRCRHGLPISWRRRDSGTILGASEQGRRCHHGGAGHHAGIHTTIYDPNPHAGQNGDALGRIY